MPQIYRVDEMIVDPKAEPFRPRTVVVDERVQGGRNQQVLRTNKICTLSIEIGNPHLVSMQNVSPQLPDNRAAINAYFPPALYFLSWTATG